MYFHPYEFEEHMRKHHPRNNSTAISRFLPFPFARSNRICTKHNIAVQYVTAPCMMLQRLFEFDTNQIKSKWFFRPCSHVKESTEQGQYMIRWAWIKTVSHAMLTKKILVQKIIHCGLNSYGAIVENWLGVVTYSTRLWCFASWQLRSSNHSSVLRAPAVFNFYLGVFSKTLFGGKVATHFLNSVTSCCNFIKNTSVIAQFQTLP